jgi:hypothetical protein
MSYPSWPDDISSGRNCQGAQWDAASIAGKDRGLFGSQGTAHFFVVKTAIV